MHIYLGMEAELLVASKRNGRWRAESRLKGNQITSLASDPELPERVYCGTSGRGLFRSWRELKAFAQLPSAPTWSFPPRPETSHVRWITPDPLASGRIFVAIEAGALVRSLDGGEHWEDRRSDAPMIRIL